MVGVDAVSVDVVSGVAAASSGSGARRGDRRRRLVALATPPALLVSTWLVFRLATAALGARPGYLAGFAFYWLLWGAVLPLWLLGVDGVRQVLADRRPRLPTPAAVAMLLLVVPPLGGAATQLLPRLDQVTWMVAATLLVVAVVNATTEELLWRGVYLQMFPTDALRGWLYPAVGFAAWHLAPTSVHGSAALIVSSALLIGVGFGWIAWRTGSIRWTTAAHIATDATGVGFATYLIGAA